PDALSRRVVIDRLRPEIDGGRFPIKRTAGETVDVEATIFADGHDVIAAVLLDAAVARGAGSSSGAHGVGRETPMAMVAPGTDRWTARFEVAAAGWHEYRIVAWIDRFLTWRRDVRVKAAAKQDVALEMLEGSLLVRDAARRAAVADAPALL